MTDINTVTLSGVLTSDVESSGVKGVPVSRFYIDVEGAGEQGAFGNFKVVAFGDWAELVSKVKSGDRVALVGALIQRKGRRQETEIRMRNLIPLSARAQRVEEWQVSKVEDGEQPAKETTEGKK